MKISAEKLRQLVSYCPLTGEMRRLTGRRAGHLLGKPNRDGYLFLWLDGQTYVAHRLAWLYVTGEWPKVVDHKNGDRSNNRWTNLRNCSYAENFQNISACGGKRNTSGHVGVSLQSRNGLWRAQISWFENGKTRKKNLGEFANKDDAIAAYKAGKRTHHHFQPEHIR